MKSYRDSLNTADPTQAATTTMAVVDLEGGLITQNRLTPGAALVSLGAALRAFYDVANIRSPEVMQVVLNVVFDGVHRRPEFKAVHQYLISEVFTDGR